MNLGTIETEVKARGFSDLSDTRLGYFINRAYHSLCELYNWPFLEATTTGTAPLTVSDLRTVLYVMDTTAGEELYGYDQRTVRERDPKLESTGSPEIFFLTGTDTINVWPANTDHTLTVRYIEVPADLATDSDTPVLPARYHYLLVDGAVLLAYGDSDSQENRAALQTFYDAEVRKMARALLDPNHFNPPEIAQARWYGDYGA